MSTDLSIIYLFERYISGKTVKCKSYCYYFITVSVKSDAAVWSSAQSLRRLSLYAMASVFVDEAEWLEIYTDGGRGGLRVGRKIKFDLPTLSHQPRIIT